MKTEDKIKALELQRAQLEAELEALKAARPIWTSQDGRKRVISDMPAPYLRNAAMAVVRNDPKYPHTVYRMREFVEVIRELERRGIEL